MTQVGNNYRSSPTRLPSCLGIAPEAQGFVEMACCRTWRSMPIEQVDERVKAERNKAYVGKEFIAQSSDPSETWAGKKVRVTGVDDDGMFICVDVLAERLSSKESEMSLTLLNERSASDTDMINTNNDEHSIIKSRGNSGTCEDNGSSKNSSKLSATSTRFNEAIEAFNTILRRNDNSDVVKKHSNDKFVNNLYAKNKLGKMSDLIAQMSQTDSSDESRESKNKMTDVMLSKESTAAPPSITSVHTVGSCESLLDEQNVIILDVENLVTPKAAMAREMRLQQLMHNGRPVKKATISFDRLERRLQAACMQFRGNFQPQNNTKDKTLYNREMQTYLQQNFRQDEIYRLDLLEMTLKAKKLSVFDLPCKDMGVFEDEEYILYNDKLALEVQGSKRLRIKNFDAAWEKWAKRERNVKYARALEKLRPACAGNGKVNFHNWDLNIHEKLQREMHPATYHSPQYNTAYENILQHRFVKFVKYGMCECCQAYYLEQVDQFQQQQQQHQQQQVVHRHEYAQSGGGLQFAPRQRVVSGRDVNAAQQQQAQGQQQSNRRPFPNNGSQVAQSKGTGKHRRIDTGYNYSAGPALSVQTTSSSPSPQSSSGITPLSNALGGFSLGSTVANYNQQNPNNPPHNQSQQFYDAPTTFHQQQYLANNMEMQMMYNAQQQQQQQPTRGGFIYGQQRYAENAKKQKTENGCW